MQVFQPCQHCGWQWKPLDGKNVRGQIQLIISGGFRTGTDVATPKDGKQINVSDED
jgi:hypothetical protein